LIESDRMTEGGGSAAGERGSEQPPPGEEAGTEPVGADAEHGERGESLERILAEARSVGRDLLDLVRVSLDRARLGARSSVFRLLVLTWLGLAGATATVLSVYFIVQGLAGLATDAFGGRAWAGRLAAGVLVLAVSGLAIGFLRGRSRRAGLRRLEARYGERARASERGETG
jgi:hypothetical protein